MGSPQIWTVFLERYHDLNKLLTVAFVCLLALCFYLKQYGLFQHIQPVF